MAEDPKETVNFRLARSYKQALAQIAANQEKALSEVIREAVEQYVSSEQRRAWEMEAQRQSQAIAERAEEAASDEAKTMEWVERMSEDMDWDT